MKQHGEHFNQFQLPPPPYLQQIQHFQNASGTGIYPYQPDYNPTIQPVNAKKERDGLRIPAFIMSILGYFCGFWGCAIPAFILAMLPECKKNLGTRSLYRTSISIISFGFCLFCHCHFLLLEQIYQACRLDIITIWS